MQCAVNLVSNDFLASNRLVRYSMLLDVIAVQILFKSARFAPLFLSEHKTLSLQAFSRNIFNKEAS